MTDLPPNWTQTPLGRACAILDSKRVPINSKERRARTNGKPFSDLFPYYGATGQVDVIDGYLFEGEHVLLGEDGAPFLAPFRDKAYVVDGKFWVNNHAHILKAHGSNKYLSHYLNAVRYGAHVTGTTRPKLTKRALVSIPIRLPPLNEQHRIVERIEALFDEIDRGVESLRTTLRTIALYRQSLLKSAFEGRLTADWRAENPDKLQNPSDLLLRIREERKVAHQQEFDDWRKATAKWTASSQIGRRPGKPKEPKFETTQPLLEVLRISTLPDDWGVAKVVAILDIVSGATPKGISSCRGTGIPFFKVADMNVAGNETHLFHALLNLSNEEARMLGLTVFPPGTTVFPKRGGAILTNKKRRLHQPSCFDLNIMGLVNHTTSISPEFAYFWMLGVDLSTIYDGSNVPQINNKNVEPLSFPICSPSEQAEVVRVLRSRLESVDALEAEIDATITRTHALRHSILKRAFSGQLVPQDPADEPASALLARVRAEHTSVPTKGRRTRARTASV